MAEGELVAERRLKIVNSLLRQSPPGEFTEVLHDIRTIVGDDAILEALHEQVREHNIESGAVAKYEVEEEEGLTKYELLLTCHNELPDGRFYNPQTRQAIVLNHYNLEVEQVVALRDADAMPARTRLELSLHEAVRGYLQKAFVGGSKFIVCQSPGQEDTSIYHVVIVGERFQPKNMRNGQWKSSWSFDAQTGHLRGEVRVQIHYFEDGNVQLHSEKSYSLDAEIEMEPAEGEEIEAQSQRLVSRIRAREDEVQLALNEAYAQLADCTFKKLRRQLPLTRSKVDWAKLASYKIGDQLRT